MKPTIIRNLAISAIVAVAAALAPQHAQAGPGEKCLGGQLELVTKNSSLGLDLFFQYTVINHLRISPRMGCILRNDDMDAFEIDLDAQAPFDFVFDKWAVYPLAGFNYTSWNFHGRVDDKDVSSRHGKFGFNVGCGVEYRIKSKLKLNFELRYTATDKVSTAKIAVGAGYIF